MGLMIPLVSIAEPWASWLVLCCTGENNNDIFATEPAIGTAKRREMPSSNCQAFQRTWYYFHITGLLASFVYKIANSVCLCYPLVGNVHLKMIIGFPVTGLFYI